MAELYTVTVNGTTYDINTKTGLYSADSTTSALPIALSPVTTDTARSVVDFTNNVTVIPSTGLLTATTMNANTFVGDLTGTADKADVAVNAENATEADYAKTAGAFASAQEIKLTGAVVGSYSSTAGWSIATSLGTGFVGAINIADNAVTLAKLADEIGVVVVQADEPSSDSAAKIWVKVG